MPARPDHRARTGRVALRARRDQIEATFAELGRRSWSGWRIDEDGALVPARASVTRRPASELGRALTLDATVLPAWRPDPAGEQE